MSWIGNAVSKVAGWLGSGIGSFFGWLFHGLELVLTKIIDAFNGFFGVFDSLWNFAVGLKDSILGLFSKFFPFVPAPVSAAIGFGLIAVLIVGIYKRVRG